MQRTPSRRQGRPRPSLTALLAVGAAGALGLSALPALAAPSVASAAGSTSAAAAAAKVNYWRGINPVTELTADTFAQPPANDKPWVRWNWPPATTTIPQLERDLDHLAAAGSAGVEIGQGGHPTNEQLQAVPAQANQRGVTVGPEYSGGAPIPGTWDATNDYTRKTLTNSRTFVNAGANFTGAVPGTGTIVAVLASRCTASP